MIKVSDMKKCNENSIGCFLIESNKFHSWFSQWVFTCIHLRRINSEIALVKQDRTKTHEFMVMAISPEFPIDLKHKESIQYLLPVDQVLQVSLTSDIAARKLMNKMIVLIREGKLNPDIDHRYQWESLLKVKSFTGTYIKAK